MSYVQSSHNYFTNKCQKETDLDLKERSPVFCFCLGRGFHVTLWFKWLDKCSAGTEVSPTSPKQYGHSLPGLTLYSSSKSCKRRTTSHRDRHKNSCQPFAKDEWGITQTSGPKGWRHQFLLVSHQIIFRKVNLRQKGKSGLIETFGMGRDSLLSWRFFFHSKVLSNGIHDP